MTYAGISNDILCCETCSDPCHKTAASSFYLANKQSSNASQVSKGYSVNVQNGILSYRNKFWCRHRLQTSSHQIGVWDGFSHTDACQRDLKELGACRNHFCCWACCAALVQDVCLIDIQVGHYLRTQSYCCLQSESRLALLQCCQLLESAKGMRPEDGRCTLQKLWCTADFEDSGQGFWLSYLI